MKSGTVISDLGAEQGTCLVQPPLDGACRAVQQPRDLVDGQVGEVVQQDRLAQPLREPFHQVAQPRVVRRGGPTTLDLPTHDVGEGAVALAPTPVQPVHGGC